MGYGVQGPSETGSTAKQRIGLLACQGPSWLKDTLPLLSRRRWMCTMRARETEQARQSSKWLQEKRRSSADRGAVTTGSFRDRV